MARISIDDELHADRRFKRLSKALGDEDLAIGMLYRFWRIAQDFWADGELVPYEEFEAEKLNALIDAGLAEEREKGIYASGSEERFQWYVQRCEASKRGVQARKLKTEEPKPVSDQPEVVFRSTETEVPDNPSLRSDIVIATAIVKKDIAQKFDFESLYEKYPRKVGKKAGMRACHARIKKQEDFDSLSGAIDRYNEYLARSSTEPQFIKHFSTFMNNWEDWSDPTTGTSSEFKKLDNTDWDYVFGKTNERRSV